MKIEQMGHFVSGAIAVAAVALLGACAAVDGAGGKRLARDSCPDANGMEAKECGDEVCEIHLSLDSNGNPQIDPKRLVLTGPYGRAVSLIWDVPDRAVFDPGHGDHVTFDDDVSDLVVATPVAGAGSAAADGHVLKASKTIRITVVPKTHRKKWRYHALWRDTEGDKLLHLCDPWVQTN